MLANLILEQGKYTPKVVFNADSGILEMSGRSLPADAVTFYKPLLEWATEYLENPGPTVELRITMEYFNTASTRQLVDLLALFEKLTELPNHSASVIWSYERDDDNMYTRGEEMACIVNLPFTYREY